MRNSAERMVLLCRAAGMICVPVQVCGLDCPSPVIAGMWLYIRRRGHREWLIKYPAWEVSSDGQVCFFIDDQFKPKPGRYEAEIRVDDVVLGAVELYVPRQQKVSLRERPKHVPPRHVNPPPKPEGVTDMYQAIEDFSTHLCEVLEPDATRLPISDDDAAFLCGLSLCRPAQLVITDGVHREIVEWRCDAGDILLDRAQSGTLAHRFPAGSIVRFEWTEQNVMNARDGC